ncbi:pyocin knob domain-containing protein [Paenibacillus amylolyticus]|nr:pyocin knob domain-containing protein [Paenibacillus amylolyticus]
MARTDWDLTKSVLPPDMNAIGEEINEIRTIANGKQSPIKLANNFAVPDTAITAYPEGYSVFYVGGGTGGQGIAWRTVVGSSEAFGYVETVRVGTGGYQTFTEMYSGSDTANQVNNKQYKRNKRDSNASWQPFERVLDLDDYNSLLTYADSGFIKKAVIIPNGDDLNNYSSSSREGRYYCPSNAGAATILNSPVTLAFSLLIERHAGVVQTLTTYEPNNPQMFQRNYYGGTWGSWYKVATAAYIDTKPWQKHKLTQDNGLVKNLPQLTDLNTLTDAGQYDGNSLRNGPLGSVDGIWFYVEVIVHSSGPTYIMQKATRLEVGGQPTFYMRTRVNNVWGPWSPDVFQSGVDAKQGIVNAINAKGGSASMNDTWATLSSKVNAIEQGFFQLMDLTTSAVTASVPAGYIGPVHSIATFPAGTKLISIAPTVASNGRFYAYANTNTNVTYAFILVDGNGVPWFVSPGFSTSAGLSLFSTQVSSSGSATIYFPGNGTVSSQNTNLVFTSIKPSSFNMNTPMNLCVYAYANTSVVTNSMTIIGILNTRIVSM